MNLETKGSSYRSYYYLNIDCIFVPNVYICHKHLKIHEIKLVLIVQGHEEARCLMLAVALHCVHEMQLPAYMLAVQMPAASCFLHAAAYMPSYADSANM